MGGFAEKNGRAGSPLPTASLVETAWPMVRLGDVCDAISCRGHQIKQTEIHAIGRFPVVSQSENQIEGYTDKDMAISDVPLIIFGDHTCIVKKVVHPFVVGADGVKLLKPKYHDIDFLFWYLKWAITALIDGEYRRHYSDLSNLQVIIPHHSVQRSIVTHLDAARERCIPCFMHVCGNIVPSIKEIASTGLSAIDVDYMVPMSLVREHCGPDTCIKGNLNPMDLLSKSSVEVYEICKNIYRETVGPMILGTGCLVAPHTPKENIDAMVRASKSMSGLQS